MTTLRQRMLEDLQIRHYSQTASAYTCTRLPSLPGTSASRPTSVGYRHIRQYQLFLIKDKQACRSTCVQLVCALRFLYTHTLNRKIEIDRIPFPRRERKLPLILSREEVKALLEAPGKLRDRAVLAVLYGSGLRVAEATQLKPRDIDARRQVLWVRQGKGRKDRQTLLPTKLLELLRWYWKAERPGDWLFPGRDRTRPVSPKAVYLACRDAAQVAGIQKPVHPHLLRHAFATHLLESGVNLRTAGHADSAGLPPIGIHGALPAGRRRGHALPTPDPLDALDLDLIPLLR